MIHRSLKLIFRRGPVDEIQSQDLFPFNREKVRFLGCVYNFLGRFETESARPHHVLGGNYNYEDTTSLIYPSFVFSKGVFVA